MLNDSWHPAFVDAGSGVVALNTEDTTGDNPITGREVSDLLCQCITDDDKLRILVTTPA